MKIPIHQQLETAEGQVALFEYASEGILVTTGTGEIVKVNPAAERMFGYEKGELTGCKVEVLIPRRYADKHMAHRGHYSEKPHPRSMGLGMDLYGLRKDGTEFAVEVSLSPYSRGEEQFVIVFIVDITQRKQSEEKLKNYSIDLEKQVESRTMVLREAIAELEKTLEELKEALQKEKELNDLKSRFVSMASHEFRTPLSTILSSLSLVSHYNGDNDIEKRHRHINRIRSSVHTLTDILDDMLSVSKLEEGKVMVDAARFDLHELAVETVREMQYIARTGQNIVLKYRGDENVETDRKIIGHILMNLLSNAIKFSPEGCGIFLNISITANTVTIEVTDQGIGIPEEEQKHLFERFFRAHNVSHIKGTGLGLHIVGRYVELLGGTINCKSSQQNGTTFMINIPHIHQS